MTLRDNINEYNLLNQLSTPTQEFYYTEQFHKLICLSRTKHLLFGKFEKHRVDDLAFSLQDSFP